MKKIVLLTFIVMMFCQVCNAAFVPDPTQWRWVASDSEYPEYQYWIDIKNVEFSQKDYGDSAKLNLLIWKDGDDVSVIHVIEINVKEGMEKTLAIAKYDGKGQFDSRDPHDKFQKIPEIKLDDEKGFANYQTTIATEIFTDIVYLYNIYKIEQGK